MGEHAGGLPADQVQAPRVAGLRHAASEPSEAIPGETSEAEGSADRDNPAGDRAGVSSGRSTRPRGAGKGQTSTHREEP